MKTIALLFLILILGFQTGNTQNPSRKQRAEQKAATVKTLIDSGNYLFEAQSATTMWGRHINLTSNYNLQLKGNEAESWLPYFGRAYRADYGDTEGGIKFKEPVRELEVTFNERRKIYEIQFDVKSPKDLYSVTLSVGLSGYGTLTVNSNNRQPITFYGSVEAIPASNDGEK